MADQQTTLKPEDSTASNSTRLLPCPFCRSTDIESGKVLGEHIDEHGHKHMYVQTGCNGCGALGPESDFKATIGPARNDFADTAWNNRAAHGASAKPARD